jgi:PAS domain S-box-containing protein
VTETEGAAGAPHDAVEAALLGRLHRLEWFADLQAQLAGLDFDLDRYMRIIVERVPEVTTAQGVIVELADGEDMVYRATSAHLKRHLGLRIPLQGSLAGLCIDTAETLYCADSENDPRVDRVACRRIGLRSMICAPLIAHGAPVGVLKALSATPRAFGPDDFEMLGLLGHTIAAALAREVAFDAMRRQIETRTRLEASLRASEARFRLMAANTTDMIVTSTLEGVTTFVSAGGVAMTGWTNEEALGRSPAEFVHPDDVAAVQAGFRRTAMGAMGVRVRWRGWHRSQGRWLWLESSPSLLIVEGEPPCFLDVVRDVTGQVEQEEALAQARKDAESLAAAKTAFLANMSHEIRTPLTAVIGFASLLQTQDELPCEARRYADRIATAGRSLLAIVNNILDLSKLEGGEMALAPKATDIAALAGDVLDLFQPQAVSKGIELAFAADAGAPSLAMVDPQALRQILFNLVGNAVKFTDRGQVTLRLSHADGALSLAVADTGPGLSAAEQQLLFQRFSQADGSSTRRHGGAGLGLAISKALAEAMGGAIALTSTPGAGSVFTLTAPAAPCALAIAADEPAPTVSIDGVRALIVDDNAPNRLLARTMIEAMGGDVAEAVDGLEAVEAAAASPFDIILMDVRMPRLDGPGAAARIRQEAGPNQFVPIYAFSAGLGAAATPDVFDGAIPKPFTMASLAAALAHALSDQIETSEEGLDVAVN